MSVHFDVLLPGFFNPTPSKVDADIMEIVHNTRSSTKRQITNWVDQDPNLASFPHERDP